MNELHITHIEQITKEASTAIYHAHTFHDLETIKSRYLGKKSKLNEFLQKLGTIDAERRPILGQAVNQAKQTILDTLAKQERELIAQEIANNLAQETIDVTLPPRGQDLGRTHPITKVLKKFVEFFNTLGFTVVTGPEIEGEFYNFTALNIPPHHPARTGHDTFYFADGTMLRSQTSTVQIRSMQKIPPPLRIISPGKVFRRDNDATHSPMFHQLEMLIIDKNLTLANLKWLIAKFIESFFQKKMEYRFRPSYFPFTEPSAEVDIKWQVGDSWRWLELGGCGVVHPNVLRAVNLDPNLWRGLAFGFGIDRLAMVYYGINDIRMLFTNDLQFLSQF